MRPRGLGKISHHRVEILDIVDHRAVGESEAIVDFGSIVIALGIRVELAAVAGVLPIDLLQGLGELGFLDLILRRIIRVDEVLETRQLVQSVLTAKLVETRYTALAIADDVESRNVDGL